MHAQNQMTVSISHFEAKDLIEMPYVVFQCIFRHAWARKTFLNAQEPPDTSLTIVKMKRPINVY